MYTNQPYSEAATEALENGVLFHKINGSNGCLFKTGDGQWSLYRRYDDKKGCLDPDNLPNGYRTLPSGLNEQSYGEKFRHSYYYRRMERIPQEKKKYSLSEKMSNAFYVIVDRNTPQLDAFNTDALTVELVGRKFNKTPGCDFDYGIALHRQQRVPWEIPRSFEGFKKYLMSSVCAEGVILEHQGRYWKIKTCYFDQKCLFGSLEGGKKNCCNPALHTIKCLK
jgi:hypothetical protein